MKNRALNFLLLGTCALLWSCSHRSAATTSSTAKPDLPPAKTLEQTVRETLDFSKFDPNSLDEHLVIVSSSSEGRHYFARQDLSDFVQHAETKGEKYEVKAFKVLEKDAELDGSSFATITYQVTWEISLDGKTTNSVDEICHEIWEREVDGWHRLFAAIDQ